jgi:hypothetical protein
MSNFSQRLLETILKDIEELEQSSDLPVKVIRKESSLIRSRVASLRKLGVEFKNELDEVEKKLESLLKSN